MSGKVLEFANTLVDGLRPGADDNWIGFCPIHGEVQGKSKASFSFNALTGQWNCFAGCGGGGLPALLKRLGKSDHFIDRSMERLRDSLQPIQLKRVSTTSGGLFLADYPLPEKLLGMFDYVPLDLIDAGFDEEVLRNNDVGFDPALQRITYAIRDLRGTLAGIVGKPVGENTGGKYRVYERELVEMGFRNYHFSNRRFLWGWDQVYPSIYFGRGEEPVFITEGYKARLWLVQHGYHNTVALMGTGLGVEQQAFLERLGTRLILCLDHDKWGRLATRKIGYKLRGLDVGVMRYPAVEEDEKLQPDDLDEEQLREALENPYSLRRWRREYNEQQS